MLSFLLDILVDFASMKTDITLHIIRFKSRPCTSVQICHHCRCVLFLLSVDRILMFLLFKSFLFFYTVNEMLSVY